MPHIAYLLTPPRRISPQSSYQLVEILSSNCSVPKRQIICCFFFIFFFSITFPTHQEILLTHFVIRIDSNHILPSPLRHPVQITISFYMITKPSYIFLCSLLSILHTVAIVNLLKHVKLCCCKGILCKSE